jgi:hypothetical protein
MTDHRRFLDLVAASIDFELTAEEHDLIAGHMATCRACRRAADGFRQDAVAIATFPQARLAPDAAAAVLERVLRRPARNRAMGRLLLAALVALLAFAAAAVGAGLIREWRDGLLVVPQPLPSRDAAIASNGPSPAHSPSEETAVPSPSPSQVPSPPVDASTWTVSEAGVDLGSANLQAVAAGPGGMVAVGGLGCTVSSDGGGSCWAQSMSSADGTTWEAIPTTDATEVGGPVTSGEVIGMNDIAGGTDGFVAIGYAGIDGVGAAVWQTTDGTEWQRISNDPGFDDAHLRTVARTPLGWLIGGAVHGPDVPRAAIWSSADGRAWRRVPDGPAFDVGGYLRTLEGPHLAGGIRDLAVRGDTTVAVGSSCDAQGSNCVPAVWTSVDGRSWDREPEVPGGSGELILVASIDSGFVAVRQDCSSNPCTSAILSSPDGKGWREVSTDGFPEHAKPHAVANVAGTIALAAVEDGRLRILASVDGGKWSIVREVSWQSDDGSSPSPDGVNVYGLGMTTRPDGSAVIVGWVSIQDAQGGVEEPFQFEIERQ